MRPGYIEGLARGARIARALAAAARGNGQDDAVVEAAEQIARVIESEGDREDTPPSGVKLCELCRGPIPG